MAEMELDLTPWEGTPALKNDAGCYMVWTSATQPILGAKKVGAAYVVLNPQGLALPHYGDAKKFGFITSGSAILGLMQPGNPKEKVFHLRQGDIIPFGLSNVVWLYNDGDAPFEMLMMGDTSEGVHPGDFSYFFLAGPIGLFSGLSTPFLSKACGLAEEQAEGVFRSQQAVLMTKVPEKITGIKTHEGDKRGLVITVDHGHHAHEDAKLGGHIISVTGHHLRPLENLGFSITFTKLVPHAMRSPGFVPDGAPQLIYVTKGSGHVQIVGTDGRNALDKNAAAGSLFVVPNFYVITVVAGTDGMEFVTYIRSTSPDYEYVTGKNSLLAGMDPHVLQAALCASPELVETLKKKGSEHGAIVPPPSQ